MEDKNEKIEKLLTWIRDKEEEAGVQADKAFDLNREVAYSRYNNIWATYGKVRKYIEELEQGK